MVLNITGSLRDQVRRMVYAKAHAEGVGTALVMQIKIDPKYGPLYAEHKAAYEESLRLEAKILAMVGGDVGLLERLIRDIHADRSSASKH
ncbi:hypothetical protein G6M78_13480 [Agrobacterium tumefaciens]|uniref:hypothetical protein n=1 Tax=Agrobacterium tumefaciens TaxID=358 RepID=UPI001571A9D8|nr:hypothetical protein [Agrobacterium tumefaciens]NTE56083.1 hypothetical protein [Agrobacterium tumefaciens]NTE74206.1 hypothetical protein [Agrobacterium tumefaciens]